MLRTVLFLALFALLSLAHAADSVVIVSSIDESQCKLAGEEVCETQKSQEAKAKAKCNKWHTKKARDLGANSIVITNRSVSESRRPLYDGRYKTIKNTSISASYYTCSAQYTATQVPKPPMEQQDNTIELRLIKLESLKEKGLITEKEYQAKRAEILEDL